MSCGVAIMKFTLIFFNVIFLLIGIAGVALGIWIAVDPQSIFEFINYSPDASTSLIQTSAYIFIAGCAIILIIAALGIFGAATGNRCLLGVYGFFVILIFIIELTALIVVIVYDQKFRTELQMELTKALKSEYVDANSKFAETVDKFQMEFKCCGINHTSDYDSIVIPGDKKTKGYQYPDSCYPNEAINGNDFYSKGCYEELRGIITTYGGIIIGVVVAVLVFEIVLFAFAMCLCRHHDFGDKVV